VFMVIIRNIYIGACNSIIEFFLVQRRYFPLEFDKMVFRGSFRHGDEGEDDGHEVHDTCKKRRTVS
jgi:hypothetical protein